MARRIVFELHDEASSEDFRAMLKMLAMNPNVRNVRQVMTDDLQTAKAIIISDDGTILGMQG